MSIELTIERRADKLYMGVSGRGGMGELTARSDGTFASEDPEGGAIVLEFEEDDAGDVTGVDDAARRRRPHSLAPEVERPVA